MKYYYINYTIQSDSGRLTRSNCVTDKHPFDWLAFYKKFSGTWSLLDYKEITKEEYEKGKEIIGTG